MFEIEQLINEARAIYHPIIDGTEGHLIGGRQLFRQFNIAAKAVREGDPSTISAVQERINELEAARVILKDPRFKGQLSYEPNILRTNRRIDFLLDAPSQRTYIEVKTIDPKSPDNEASWQRHLRHSDHAPDNVHYLVGRAQLGASIANDAFAARSKFINYATEFEDRLQEARQMQDGIGVLVFCGFSIKWHPSNLEDFVHFYKTGSHRSDDWFSRMEAHEMELRKIKLLRNIDHFAYLRRDTHRPKATRFLFPVSPRE